ncbi:hypothetical protein OPT61_g100 [Boeremia exigua]|uniref:Uncharacterized protein n=1 Tax=Boeremia exigua TaxID=749465 RepID=A0ACC2IVD0_9PLEO|nr:hypothetical protein OPT61_g100 [Boeremia exigua]
MPAWAGAEGTTSRLTKSPTEPLTSRSKQNCFKIDTQQTLSSMAGDADDNVPSGIAALPPSTVRQLGSHQLLTDPSSVVKELIDNALDARAKNIFVDITANTIDSIQVKDDGHGIPNEDRALACRRYCTSKIRDFHDLKQVGGKWLGFRGEALASVADMSGTVLITTRVEGEPVAVKLTFQRNGELALTERDSHPVGTTVKLTKLLDSAKVRREVAVKGSAKCLARIRRLMQAYALARPAVRFRLHVLKAKNNKGDFNYAPKAEANVEDAAFKVVGKECALQCDWTALEMGGFELHAFLPKPTAVASKIANHGVFLSVDFRPVSALRGTLKKIAAAFRHHLRKTNATLAGVKDPFFSMSLICPVDSYDPNIKPAKDDIIFGDESFIIELVNRLLISFYPGDVSSTDAVNESEPMEEITTQPDVSIDLVGLSPQPHTSFSIHQDSPVEELEASSVQLHTQQPRWRSSMYGIDEEDLEKLPQNTPVTVEDEEGSRDVAISNPWTIARMNAPVKPRKAVSNGQLLSPAKSQEDDSISPQSPIPVASPHRSYPVEPLSPQTTSKADVHGTKLHDELQQSIQHLPPLASPDVVASYHSPDLRPRRGLGLASIHERSPLDLAQSAPQASDSSTRIALFPGTTERRGNPRSRRALKKSPPVPPAPLQDDTWFGQPMRSGPAAARSQRHSLRSGPTIYPMHDPLSSQYSLVMPASENLPKTRLTSNNNTDIRGFFGKSRNGITNTVARATGRETPPQEVADQLRAYAEQETTGENSLRRPQSVGSGQRSTNITQEMEAIFELHQNVAFNQSLGPTQNLGNTDARHAANSTPCPRRRHVTNSDLHRTKSSTLPLNYIPCGSAIHTLSLTINTNILFVVQQARKLDMTANSLEWGYDSTDAFDVFGIPILERKIMEWVIQVDCLLHAVFERVDGVEVRGALHEGIQRFLDTRKKEDDNSKCLVKIENAQLDSLNEHSIDLQDIGHNVVIPAGEDTDYRRQEKTADTDTVIHPDKYSQDSKPLRVTDLNEEGRQARSQTSPVRAIKAEDEFGNEIDDEMLMDL